MEFRLLDFSSTDIKPSGIPQSLQSIHVARIIPFIIGSMAQSILGSQLLNLDFTSSEVDK